MKIIFDRHMNLSSFLFLLAVLSPIINFSQVKVDDLIDLHRNNMRQLSNSRGASPEWLIPEETNLFHLQTTLNHFYRHKRVGVLIYTHSNDSLQISLVTKFGVEYNSSIEISKENLENAVIKTNLFYSHSKSDTDELRGGVGENLKSDQNTHVILNTQLFPVDLDLYGFDHLIIVPTLNIGILPFSVFKISNSDYLIDKMSYSISPSVFEIYASLKSTVNFEFDTNFYDFKERLFVYKTDFKSSDNFQFSDLKYTKTEVEAINSLYKQGNSEVLGNKDATVANVLKSIPDADLIYFATHGKSSIKNPLDDSFIVLTNDSGLKNDFLTARDIQNLRFRSQSIDAKLAVLSACDTGLGKPEDGGIIGISRALQIAGANHVLMSLWNISDFETSEFMKMFFNELSKSDNTSLEPDTSLRKALLKFRKEVSNDPKHWAAFSLFGVPNPSKHTYGKSTEELNSIFSLYKDISIEDTSLKKNNEIIFDFKLVPVSDSAVSNKRFNPSELTKDIYKVVVRDSLIVEVHNNSKIPIYLSILDISEYQEYYNFLPNSRCSFDKNNRKVEPGQTIRFTDCVFTFSFDYGKYILKAIATSAPVNLRDDVEFKSLKEQTNQIIFNDGSTFFYSNDSEIQFNSLDLLYEIVEEP